jgi:hypothetical protein
MDLSYENKAEPAQLEKTQELLDKHIVRTWQCPNSALGNEFTSIGMLH